jgi:apolipoprotein N-acyltransferase
MQHVSYKESISMTKFKNLGEQLTYLGVGILLYWLSFHWPALMWFTPIPFLIFSRCNGSKIGLFTITAAYALVLYFKLQGIVPVPEEAYLFVILISALTASIPYAIDKILCQGMPNPWQSLIFPSAMVASYYLSAQASPFGTWGNPAYSQLYFESFIQFASVLGLWGVIFVMSWCSSAAVSMIRDKDKYSLIGFMAVFLMTLAYGLVHLQNKDNRNNELFEIAMIRPTESALISCARGNEQCFNKRRSLSQQEMVANSKQAISQGARIVLWSEAAAQVLASDQQAFIEQNILMAKEAQIYLVMSLWVTPSDASKQSENKLVAITPEGNVAWQYHKAKPVPGEPIIKGNASLPYLDTPFGRFSALICFDADFPDLARQASRLNADYLLIAAKDWDEIATIHQNIAVLRGIENGLSIIRATTHGNSTVSDFSGHITHSLDVSKTEEAILIAEVKKNTRINVYPLVGDVPALIITLALIVLYMFMKRRQKRMSLSVN